MKPFSRLFHVEPFRGLARYGLQTPTEAIFTDVKRPKGYLQMEIVANATDIHKCKRQGGRECSGGGDLGGGWRGRGRKRGRSPDVVRSTGEGATGALAPTPEPSATPNSPHRCTPSLLAFASLSYSLMLSRFHPRHIYPAIPTASPVCASLEHTFRSRTLTYT